MKTIQLPVDETHSPILIYDNETLEIIEANPAAQELYGYNKQEFESLAIHDLVPDEEVSKLDKYQEGEKESMHTSLWRNQTRDGSIIYVRILANYVTYNGRKCRFAIIHDVTDKIRSQQKYEVERKLLKSLLQKLPGIYLLVDEDQKIQRWNQRLETMTGWTSEQLENTKITDLVGDSRATNISNAVESTLDGEENEFETVLQDQDGQMIPTLINTTPVEMEKISYVQIVGLDISRLKETETDLRQANSEKETMLSEIHHRVKNNLAVVSSMMELQVMEEERPEVVEKLEDAKLRIKSIALIHELLYQSESFTDIDFSENLKKLVETISDTLQIEGDINIDYDLQPVKLNVNAALPLANIANELLTNAYQHAFEHRKEGQIRIELFEKNEMICFNMRDNGQGLPEDFDREKSSSLGWSIINSLLNQLDADIEVYNDGGANFEITLPRKEGVKGSASNMKSSIGVSSDS